MPSASPATARVASLCAALLCGCASAPLPISSPAGADGAAGPVLAPNAHLRAEGLAPIPMSLVEAVRKYTDFSGHGFADWHPERREMLVAHRPPGGDTTQIFRLRSASGRAEQLTDSADAVRRASYEPLRGDYIVFERGQGGDEANQLYRLDPTSTVATQITKAGQRHEMQGWLHRSSRLLVLSLPLDRTAAGGSRTAITQTLSLLDPAEPQTPRQLADLPGGGWGVGGVSHDDRALALTRYLSATESQVWLFDMASGALRQVLPAPGEAAATHEASEWKHDGSGFFVIGDRAGEFSELLFYRLADGALTRVTRGIPWDVAGISLDASGRLLAVLVNVEGRQELRFFDADTFDELPAPTLPAGSAVAARFHPRLPVLALALNDARAPSRIAVLDPASAAVQPWTTPVVPPGIDTALFGEQRIVRWKSFDGRDISGLLSAPPARFAGRRPVLIDIHGGPESQATFGFLGRLNYAVEELGIAVIRPNVRGSSGFGKTFVSLDDGMKREDAVKDIGALLDWIGRQPNLDPARVLVTGGSYGGYMSLAVAARYALRIAGAIDVVGISNFVSFLQRTESYRRDLRRVEYGDERDPAMRDFLTRISPLTSAARIAKPLFVIQGRNDPRVPHTEAEQIVAKLRDNGTPVWYLLADNEGHGFARKENADFQFYAMVMFMRETLLK